MTSIHLVPIVVKKDTNMEGVFFGPTRCGAPSMLGAFGTYQEDGERIWIVGFEWPDSYRVADKTRKERLHLDRFIVDFRAGCGVSPYTSVRVGPDPPDFICGTADGEIGVELTQLMVQDRVEASAQFERLKKAIMAARLMSFAAVAGHVVYVSFEGSEKEAARPPADAGIVSRVVAEIAALRPVAVEGGLPEELGPETVRQFEGGSLTAAPLTAEPSSGFFRLMGFELAFAYHTTVELGTAWATFQNLVGRHDKPGVEELILSAEAPTTSGLAYPSDGILAQAVLTKAETTPVTAKHIGRILLHTWGTRGIFELIPGEVGYEIICEQLS